MHVGTNTGVVSSRKVAIAGLPHGHMAYTVFWFSIQRVSVSFGVIGRGLSTCCTCLHEWLRRMSHGCVNIWVTRTYVPLPCTHLMRDALNEGKRHKSEYRDFMSNYSCSCRLVFLFRRPHKDRPPGTKFRCSQVGPDRDNITGYAHCKYFKVKHGSMTSRNLP
jgi:hypothetical protein